MEPANSHSWVIAIYVLREDPDYAIFDVELAYPPMGDPEDYDYQPAFEVYVDQDGQPDFAWEHIDPRNLKAAYALILHPDSCRLGAQQMLCNDLMADRRAVTASARVSPTELADWRAKAVAAGVPLSALLRQAMARTRTWNAPAAAVERERTRQVARWANTHASAAEAIEVVAHLVSIERALAARASVGCPDPDAH